MKKLREVKNLNIIFNNHITELDCQLQIQIKKIKQEYMMNLLDEKLKLLSDICSGENLNFDQLKDKYFKSRDLNKYNQDNINIESIIDEDVLTKILLDDKEYYIENKEVGNVYDIDSKIVGIFKDGKIIFN
jgi:hypothetical protein